MASHLQRNLQSFPPAQQKAIMAALQGVRCRVDGNLTAVALPYNATTTMATLTCPAAELYEGACMHIRVSGTLTNTSTGAVNFTPLIALNGTTLFSGVQAVADAGTDVDKAFLLEAFIYWQTPTVVVADGVWAVSAASTTLATGTGSAAAVATQFTPFYHTLSSQVMGRDQIITATMAIPNTATASGSKKIATLLVG